MKAPVFLFFLLLVSCTFPKNPPEKQEWITLFNGKDLTGWDIKIKGSGMNVNYKNTFRVEDGLLKVRYDEYEKFSNEFGHIFFNKSFSNYKLRIEYRFVGDQCPDGPSWAFRNSGVMLHSQSASSMGVNQDFPVSIEGQFLGGDGVTDRHTSNVCTPGTNIVMNDLLITQHCVESSSKTYHGDEWVTAEFVVMADKVIHHILEGDTVMTYYYPQVGGNSIPDGFPLAEGTLLKEGFICLQSESHPIDFRKVEILELKDKR